MDSVFKLISIADTQCRIATEYVHTMEACIIEVALSFAVCRNDNLFHDRARVLVND